MEDIVKRGLPVYFTTYLNYKLGNIATISKELYKELPNDLKEYVDCLVDGTEGVDFSKFIGYPVAYEEYVAEKIAEKEAKKCKAPVASPAAGTYDSAQSVTLTSATEDATIYYTTDGTDPTAESTEYSSAISISETTTLKAIAVKDGLDNSNVLTAEYTIS